MVVAKVEPLPERIGAREGLTGRIVCERPLVCQRILDGSQIAALIVRECRLMAEGVPEAGDLVERRLVSQGCGGRVCRARELRDTGHVAGRVVRVRHPAT